MRSGSEKPEPGGSSSVAVAEAPEALLESAAPEFVYNPWKLKELRRLYVNLTDGSKVGYLDLATLDAVPEPGVTGELLQRALAGLSPPAAVRRFIQAAQPAPRPGYVLPWTDLSANRPGQLIENQDDASYKAGVASRPAPGISTTQSSDPSAREPAIQALSSTDLPGPGVPATMAKA